MIALLNAAPDTGNQGVSALCMSAIDGLRKRGIGNIAIADHGRGVRTDKQGNTRFGLSHTRRFWRSDCLRTVRAQTALGAFAGSSAKVLKASGAVLDISGGDSFTDLYGKKRFGAMSLSKRVALQAGRPLFLLPQTLGPFVAPDTLREAIRTMRSAERIWVRDQRSHDLLANELGRVFDPRRHRKGPDIAVLLPAKRPKLLSDTLNSWLELNRTAPLAGLNVSGLLYQNAVSAREQFGLAESHRDQIEAVARGLLHSTSNGKLLLLSHVTRPQGDPESDLDAATHLAARLSADFPRRIEIVPSNFSAEELKWILSQLDWFAGARMHATIGAFSSGVPTLGLGYSDKAQGVFSECGLDREVADLRRFGAAELAQRATHSFENRDALKAMLRTHVPNVRARAEVQMDDIASSIKRALA